MKKLMVMVVLGCAALGGGLRKKLKRGGGMAAAYTIEVSGSISVSPLVELLAGIPSVVYGFSGQ